MAFVQLQSATASVNRNTASPTITLNVGATADLAVVTVYVDDTSENDLSGVPTSSGDTWIELANSVAGQGANQKAYIFYCLAPSTDTSKVITVPCSSTDTVINAVSFSGEADSTQDGFTGEGPYSVPLVTPDNADSIFVMSAGQSNNGVYTQNQGHPEIGQGAQGGAEKFSGGGWYEIRTDTDPQTVGFNTSKSGNGILLVAEIKLLSAAAGLTGSSAGTSTASAILTQQSDYPYTHNFTTAIGTGVSGLTLNYPNSIQEDDLLLIVIGNDDAGTATVFDTPPTGFTTISNTDGNITDTKHGAFYKWATGLESGTIAANGSSGDYVGWFMLIKNVDSARNPVALKSNSGAADEGWYIGTSDAVNAQVSTGSNLVGDNSLLVYSHIFDGGDGMPFTTDSDNGNTQFNNNPIPTDRELQDSTSGTGVSGWCVEGFWNDTQGSSSGTSLSLGGTVQVVDDSQLHLIQVFAPVDPNAASGTSAGTSTVSGTLIGYAPLTGTSAGTSTVTGVLTVEPVIGPLTGTSAGSSTVTGVLGVSPTVVQIGGVIPIFAGARKPFPTNLPATYTQDILENGLDEGDGMYFERYGLTQPIKTASFFCGQTSGFIGEITGYIYDCTVSRTNPVLKKTSLNTITSFTQNTWFTFDFDSYVPDPDRQYAVVFIITSYTSGSFRLTYSNDSEIMPNQAPAKGRLSDTTGSGSWLENASLGIWHDFVFDTVGVLTAKPDNELIGASAGTSTATGTLTIGINILPISGTSAGVSTATAVLTVGLNIQPLVGAVFGSSTATGTLTIGINIQPISGTSAGTTTVTGILTGTGAIKGDVGRAFTTRDWGSSGSVFRLNGPTEQTGWALDAVGYIHGRISSAEIRTGGKFGSPDATIKLRIYEVDGSLEPSVLEATSTNSFEASALAGSADLKFTFPSHNLDATKKYGFFVYFDSVTLIDASNAVDIFGSNGINITYPGNSLLHRKTYNGSVWADATYNAKIRIDWGVWGTLTEFGSIGALIGSSAGSTTVTGILTGTGTLRGTAPPRSGVNTLYPTNTEGDYNTYGHSDADIYHGYVLDRATDQMLTGISYLFHGKTGTPDHDFVIRFYEADGSDEPTGGLIASTEIIAVGSITNYQWNTFNFATPVLLDSAKRYIAYLQAINVTTIDTSNYQRLSTNTGADYVAFENVAENTFRKWSGSAGSPWNATNYPVNSGVVFHQTNFGTLVDAPSGALVGSAAGLTTVTGIPIGVGRLYAFSSPKYYSGYMGGWWWDIGFDHVDDQHGIGINIVGELVGAVESVSFIQRTKTGSPDAEIGVKIYETDGFGDIGALAATSTNTIAATGWTQGTEDKYYFRDFIADPSKTYAFIVYVDSAVLLDGSNYVRISMATSGNLTTPLSDETGETYIYDNNDGGGWGKTLVPTAAIRVRGKTSGTLRSREPIAGHVTYPFRSTNFPATNSSLNFLNFSNDDTSIVFVENITGVSGAIQAINFRKYSAGTGSPDYTGFEAFVLEIQNANGDPSTNTVEVGVSDIVTKATWQGGSGWFRFNFTNTVVLDPAKKYGVGIRFNNPITIDGSNYERATTIFISGTSQETLDVWSDGGGDGTYDEQWPAERGKAVAVEFTEYGTLAGKQPIGGTSRTPWDSSGASGNYFVVVPGAEDHQIWGIDQLDIKGVLSSAVIKFDSGVFGTPTDATWTLQLWEMENPVTGSDDLISLVATADETPLVIGTYGDYTFNWGTPVQLDPAKAYAFVVKYDNNTNVDASNYGGMAQRWNSGGGYNNQVNQTNGWDFPISTQVNMVPMDPSFLPHIEVRIFKAYGTLGTSGSTGALVGSSAGSTTITGVLTGSGRLHNQVAWEQKLLIYTPQSRSAHWTDEANTFTAIVGTLNGISLGIWKPAASGADCDITLSIYEETFAGSMLPDIAGGALATSNTLDSTTWPTDQTYYLDFIFATPYEVLSERNLVFVEHKTNITLLDVSNSWTWSSGSTASQGDVYPNRHSAESIIGNDSFTLKPRWSHEKLLYRDSYATVTGILSGIGNLVGLDRQKFGHTDELLGGAGIWNLDQSDDEAWIAMTSLLDSDRKLSYVRFHLQKYNSPIATLSCRLHEITHATDTLGAQVATSTNTIEAGSISDSRELIDFNFDYILESGKRYAAIMYYTSTTTLGITHKVGWSINYGFDEFALGMQMKGGFDEDGSYGAIFNTTEDIKLRGGFELDLVSGVLTGTGNFYGPVPIFLGAKQIFPSDEPATYTQQLDVTLLNRVEGIYYDTGGLSQPVKNFAIRAANENAFLGELEGHIYDITDSFTSPTIVATSTNVITSATDNSWMTFNFDSFVPDIARDYAIGVKVKVLTSGTMAIAYSSVPEITSNKAPAGGRYHDNNADGIFTKQAGGPVWFNIEYDTVAELTAKASNALVGASAGTSTATGVLTGTGNIIGASAGTSTATGVLTVGINILPLVGASAGSSTATGVLTVGINILPLVGASAGSSTATGVLTVGINILPLVGASAGTSTVSGFLSAVGGGLMSGTSNGSTTITGVLTATGELIGSSAGSSTATGILIGYASLTGASAGTSTATGTLTVGINILPLVGASAGTSTVTGVLTVGINILPLVGASAGSSTVTGVLTVGINILPLVGASAGSSTVTGVLTSGGSIGALTGASAGTSTATGVLTVGINIQPLVGSASGTYTVTSTLIGYAPLAGSSSGLATVTGLIIGKIYITGSSAGIATVTGTLTIGLNVLPLVGSSAGTSTATGLMTGQGSLIGEAHGLATATGVIQRDALEVIDKVVVSVDDPLSVSVSTDPGIGVSVSAPDGLTVIVSGDASVDVDASLDIL